jgi:hypothetical protein
MSTTNLNSTPDTENEAITKIVTFLVFAKLTRMNLEIVKQAKVSDPEGGLVFLEKALESKAQIQTEVNVYAEGLLKPFPKFCLDYTASSVCGRLSKKLSELMLQSLGDCYVGHVDPIVAITNANDNVQRFSAEAVSETLQKFPQLLEKMKTILQ